MRPGLITFPALAVTCAAVLAGPALAAAVPTEPAKASASEPVAVSGSAKVDDAALRYYAQQGQTDRVEAEIRHLQSISPGYLPPADLYKVSGTEGSPEDQPLWDLFGADKLEELKAGIAARMAEDTGWKPPAELVAKIKLKETRRKLLALSGDQQWKKLIQLAKDEPDALDSSDVELMWAVAESYARSKQTTEALEIYTNLLKKNDKTDERLATLQKSMAVLRMVDVETLYALGRKGTDGTNEFDVILTDLTRARISAFLHDERKDDLNQDHVKLFADFARTAADPNQPGLVAWYHYKRREFSDSLEWFKFALEKGGDAKIAHGLAHSLRQLRKFRETEEVAFAWRDFDVANRLLFVDVLEMDLTKEIPPYIEDERLARYGRLAADDASGEAAQALAWYAYNSCQYYTALEWFQRANAWLPKEATAYGLALTYRRLGDRKSFVDIVNRYDGLFPKVVALIFPDDRYLPPTPCEETVIAPQVSAFNPNRTIPGAMTAGAFGLAPGLASAAPGVTGVAPGGLGLQQSPEQTLTGNGSEVSMPNPMTDPTIAYAPGTAPNYPGSIHDPLWRYSWGRVPSPTGQPFRAVPPNYHGEPWQPARFNPNEFPLMIDPQNPLRFLATGAPTASPAPAAALPVATQLPMAREPILPPWPLLARKVPGVLPMPYETNGFTLQYATIPDPHHKGALIQTLRFVPPQGFGQSPGPGFGQGYRLPASAPLPPPVGVQGAYAPAAAPQSRFQRVSMDVTGTTVAPPAAALPGQGGVPQAYAAAVPAYPAPAALLPPGYQPVVTPMQPQQIAPQPAGNVYAPAPAFSAAPAYAPVQSYGIQPQFGTAAAAYGAPAYVHPPVRSRTRRAYVAPARHYRTRVAARAGYGCGGGGSYAHAALTQGWCLLNADRPREAAMAFDQAMQSGQGKTREDAAYGKSLASLRVEQTDSALQSANSVAMSPQHRNEIGVAVLAQKALLFYNQGNYRDALYALDQRMAHTAETRDLSMMRGWSLFHLDRTEEAERLFSALDRQTSTKESRQGLGAIDARMTGRNR